MNFGDVFARAWNIIWKNKVLWIFGLLAGLGGGSGSNFRFNFNMRGTDMSGPMGPVARFFENIPDWAIVLAVLLGLVVFVAFVLLSALGRAGLARGAWLADSGEGSLNFSRLFQEGKKYFGRVLILGILIFALSLGLILLLALPTALAAALTMGIAMICILPLLCLLIPAFYALNVVVELAVVAITGEDLGVMDGLRRGWEVFRAHLGEMVAVGVILLIGTAVTNFLVGLPVLAISAPFIVSAIMSSSRMAAGSLAVAAILFLLYLPILLIANGIVTSYVTSTWAVSFRRLTGRGPASSEVVDITPQSVV